METVTSLADELPGATVEIERTEIDFGRPEAHPSLKSGWGQDEGSGDGTFVWSVGDESVLSLFLAETRPLELTLRARPAPFPSLGPQGVDVAANGRPIGAIELSGPDDHYRIALPEEVLVPGENHIAFRYRWARSPAEMSTGSTDVRRVAVQWIHLDVSEADRDDTAGSEPPEAIEPSSPTPAVPPEAEGPDDRAGLWLPVASRTVFHLEVPPEAWLAIEWLEGDGRLEVEVARRGAPGRERVTLAADSPSVRVPLTGPRTDLVRIALTAFPAEDVGPIGALRIRAEVRRLEDAGSDAGLDVAAPFSNVSPSADNEAATRPDPLELPNIILYIVDTLRADRLGVYGYERPTTPHVDAFAKDALVFDRALAQAPYTRPSTASILTGLSPATHGVLGLADVLPSEATTLAEILGGSGYETTAFVANGNVIGEFGFAEGYDHFADLSGPGRTRKRGFQIHARHAEGSDHDFVAPLNEFVFDWLDKRSGDRPLFLYVHAVEPHSPYNPPASYRERFAPDVGRSGLDPETEAIVARLQQAFVDQGIPQARREIGSRAWLHALAAGSIPPTERLIADLEALYDAEVAYADAAFGALLEALEKRGLLEDAIVAFVSDHGEEFYEHGSWEHGKTLHAEVLRVPLILRVPGLFPQGQRVPGIARHIDLLPTLLDAAGIPVPAGIDGESLLARVRGRGEHAARASFAFVDLNGFVGQSVEETDWKLIEALRPTARISLFSRKDPGEHHDLADRDPILAGWLAAQIRWERARGRARSLVAPTTEIDPELEARLRAMGYVR